MPTNQPPVDISKSLSQIKEIISKNDSGIIVLPAKPTPDAIAAGTALYMVLTKMGKNITLVASSVPESDMIGVDKIKTDLSTGGDNLIVSFPYEDGSIDKVDYNIKDERFNLIIVPRTGHEKLQPKDIQFTYSGGKIDFIFTIDTPNLNAIGEAYTKNQRDFEGSTIINIDRHLINSSYGMVNYVVKTSSSTSELILSLIRFLKVTVDRDSATNLYAGVAAATNNFTAYSVNADTFEAIAELLRAGAIKKPVNPMGGMNMNQFGGNPFMQAPAPQPMSGSFSQPPVQQQQQRPRNEQQNRSLPQVEKSPRAPEGQIDRGSIDDELKPRIFSDEEGIL